MPTPRTRRTFYYHGSATALPEGRTLAARPLRSNEARMQAEALFERLRPPSKPSRRGAFFLGKLPHHLIALGPTSLDYVYRVTAEGPIHRGDFAWLLEAGTYEMQARIGVRVDLSSAGTPLIRTSTPGWTETDEQVVVGLIAKYWRGVPSPKARFEYHTPSIHIVDRITPRPHGHV